MGNTNRHLQASSSTSGLAKKRRLEQEEGNASILKDGPQPRREVRLSSLKARKTNPRVSSVPSRQELRNDPSPTDNATTRHLQKYLKNGNELTEEAARGVLFHTVTNQPLDVARFNAGYDSDKETTAETEFRLKLADEQLAEVVDMEPIEKVFFALWNQFRQFEYKILSDGDIYRALMAFVRKYGGEIRRMSMQFVLLKLLKEVWDNGTIDGDGVHDVMKEYYACNAKVEPGKPHPDFIYAHRMMREAKIGVDYKQAALDEPLNDDMELDPSASAWMEAEAERIQLLTLE